MSTVFKHTSDFITRKKIQELQEDLEVEKAITYFASSLINQTTIEEVLWDVVKNCIARLQFIDCVIYQLDTKRNLLIQKAAHGPKNPKNYEIAVPIEIPLGLGIVGSVAQKGQGEIIKDTSKDKRYIVDDEQRYSEITVPIMWEGKVLGVIDAEHPNKNFFRSKHLRILTTIASLCAHKIKQVELTQAYGHAQLQLAATQKRMAEIKLLALRMQINPHFIFNSLNSINNFILQKQEDLATGFLTKFSRLMRQVLANAQNEWVSLQNELMSLQMYLELEQLRCDSKFSWTLQVSEPLNPEQVLIPPFIMQPYVENAIWHGLLPKTDGPALLQIRCTRAENTLTIQIQDNGMGRKAAAGKSPVALTTHKLYGTQIIEERLQTVNELYHVAACVQINDLCDSAGTPLGTCVTYTMLVK